MQLKPLSLELSINQPDHLICHFTLEVQLLKCTSIFKRQISITDLPSGYFSLEVFNTFLCDMNQCVKRQLWNLTSESVVTFFVHLIGTKGIMTIILNWQVSDISIVSVTTAMLIMILLSFNIQVSCFWSLGVRVV